MFNKIIFTNHFKKIESLLFGMIGAIVIFIITHYLTPQQMIGTVNITGIVDQFIKQESHKNLPPDVIKNEISKFGLGLEKTVHEFSQENHIILVPSEAVVSGAVDYTVIINQRLNNH
jgi:hypothetical protein